jgi:hypothetical protein
MTIMPDETPREAESVLLREADLALEEEAVIQ